VHEHRPRENVASKIEIDFKYFERWPESNDFPEAVANCFTKLFVSIMGSTPEARGLTILHDIW
jgi:hypothetical protein